MSRPNNKSRNVVFPAPELPTSHPYAVRGKYDSHIHKRFIFWKKNYEIFEINMNRYQVMKEDEKALSSLRKSIDSIGHFLDIIPYLAAL